ncbi:sigma-70 family RNA polymerase sigma factor [Acutalibacter sp. 1XD8-33]|uniref:sigma-70 family RNA polymerase sigma factor n=1 Tax=Acutalibacter sp. 1XD8-33 TaxID=2320081 RepID=UPI0013143DEE|nr:sigma-70 family RNA polymerase sigma factor [Acutalibacter sp. 1XD8-33]
MPISTEKLVRRAQSGDKEAFVALMESHKLSLTRAAMAILHDREDVADAVAETVVEAFSQLCRLRQPKYFKTWLTRALICNCYDILRQKRRYVPLDQLPEPESSSTQPSDQVLDIQESLCALAENDRLVLTLHYMDGFKLREIAKMLGANENTVKTRLMRSRQRLQKIYLEREGNPCEAK